MSFNIYAQDTKSTKIETENGKKYYIHTVEKGQSLYSIAKLYAVEVDDIKNVNSGLSKDIKPKQIIKIPFKKESSTTIDKDKPATYVVVKGDNLNAIAKKFNTNVDELMKLNPELKDGLKAGQTLKLIVEKKIVEENSKPFKDSVVIKTVEKEYNCADPNLKDVYNVALMIPLYLEDVNKIDIDNHSSNTKANNFYRSFTFIQFYEGFLMALDSLKNLGLSVKLYVYDVDEDSALMQKIIKKPELEKMDLIIGPFFTKNLSTIAKFAKRKHINIIDPVTSDGDILNGNSNVFKATPSMATQLGKVAEYVISNFLDKNIIIVHNNKENEKPILSTFKAEFVDQLKSLGKSKELKECVFNTAGIGGLTKLMSKTDENVIITLASGEVFVTNYVNKLNDLLKNYKITLFGLPSWRTFDNIEIDYFQNLNLHLFSSSFIDYSNPKVKNFLRSYREKYKTEPDKFAFIGYDIASYFLSLLKKYGNDFENCISDNKYDGIQTSYLFMKNAENSKGKENTFVNIYKYQEYNLVNAKKQSTPK